ncbi:beta-galactosidase [Konateibacter massiliensis]|uniref:beta-galactosidase n=1 Tax=Konateibacter massiliensis TaxID=2002841 RepID=UPI000C14921F|nr:beta-galactosidase [Konateibacter massiliensis]
MKYSDKVSKIVYGGDYNPEQWTEDIWEEDMRLLKLAGIDILTLNVFNWATLQPSEEEYRFDKLDKIMDLVREHGFFVCLATSTGAHPAWMARKYPDILRVEFNGMKRKFGGRHNSCPNSPTYQKYSVELARRLAERYQSYENIVAWHVSNEFGGECYCENCEKAFRLWLKEKYGTLEELNRAWNTTFWGHTFYDWEEIVLPNLLSEHFEHDRTQFQGISLDYRRFNSESLRKNFQAEYEVIKKVTPHIPITTNFMGSYKPLDYKDWANYLDFISWDNYPANEDSPAQIAFQHDLMRGIKGGKPFVLMEQTPSVSNWLSYNALKRPNVMRLLSYQAVAHGADGVMFFQMRRSVGACEKLHGAVIDHAGHKNTRVYREVQALGEELKGIGENTLGATAKNSVALYFDWDNWWAIEYSAGPSRELKYKDEVMNYYEALHRQNIPVDIIGPEDELTPYKIVIAPTLYMTKNGYEEKLKRFVEAGGTFVTTFFSGIVEKHDLVVTGGYPGPLRELLGIWVEESDALPPDMENEFIYEGEAYPAKLLCDISHLEGAGALAVYEKDFYKGTPALTAHSYGRGRAYYVGTRSSEEFYTNFLKKLCEEQGIKPLAAPVANVEVTKRINEMGSFLFFLNHAGESREICMEQDGVELLTNRAVTKGERITMQAKDVRIIKLERKDNVQTQASMRLKD